MGEGEEEEEDRGRREGRGEGGESTITVGRGVGVWEKRMDRRGNASDFVEESGRRYLIGRGIVSIHW